MTTEEFEEAAKWFLKIGLMLGWDLARENARLSNIFDGESLDNLEFFDELVDYIIDTMIDSCFDFVEIEEMLEERQRNSKS